MLGRKIVALMASGWLKKSGIALFVLFFIKGLVWVGIAISLWLGFSK
jgi:hypothetical protein